VGTRTGGGFYGYKIDAAVCSLTGLPLAWQVRTARRNESLFVAPLIDAVKARGYEPQTAAMDRGYDNNRVFDETRERGCVPIIALRKGRAIPLTTIPYGSPEWKNLYRRRVAVEREFGRLKHEFALAPLRVRGLARVQLHADLCILTRLATALARAKAVLIAA
jgi:IS5 family transposase